MNPTDEWLRSVFKMKEDFLEFHGTCGLSKASNIMKSLLNILELKYNSLDVFTINVTSDRGHLSG